MNLNCDNINSLPNLFNELIAEQYPSDVKRIVEGSCRKVVSLRVNLLKSTPDDILAKFNTGGIKLNKVNWADDVFYSDCELSVIKNTEVYNNGELYLQSLSSCLPVLLLEPKISEDILDMTAAPGGKTTQIASLSCGKANITACERHPMRFERLKYNLNKQGVKNVNVINKDARQLEDWFKFDKILLDAPCSGSGTLVSDADNNSNFTNQLLNNTVKTQKALFEKAVKLLKKGGILVYSTCSILKQENEDIIKNYIDKKILEIVKIDKSHFCDIPFLPSTIDGVMTVCPNEHFEGFFVAVLKKL